MVSKLNNWSIRKKLTFGAMLTTTTALALVLLAIGVFEYVASRQRLMDRMETLAQVIGGNSTAAIQFNNKEDAASTLRSLVVQKNIEAACIFTPKGEILATYTSAQTPGFVFPPRLMENGEVFVDGALDIYEPAILDGKTVGTVYIRSNLDDIYHRTYVYAGIGAIVMAVGLTLAFFMVGRLQAYVSSPILQLAEITRKVSEHKDYSLRAPRATNDEVGQLADAFNMMLDSIRDRDAQIQRHLAEVQESRDMLETRVQERTKDLKNAVNELNAEMARRQEAESRKEQMQSDLVEASRRAGMADVATGVLHNVGNVLNSINVSTQLLHDSVKASRVGTLGKAAEMLAQHQANLPEFLANDTKGKALPSFLVKISAALQSEHEAMIKEIDGLSSNIGHIREIVAMQQSLAKVSGVSTTFSLLHLIDDALKINRAGLERHQVVVIKEVDEALNLNADRHKVLQILINLVSNAKYAVDSTRLEERRIAIRSQVEDGKVSVSVTDNGIGIDPEHMTKIFGYGFTTKKQGHGFGLHSSSLAAKELGGTLAVSSEGRGKGACFTLTLPLTREVAHAA